MILPANVESVPMTAEGYARRCRELADLRGQGRRELSERLRDARRDGDIADNPLLQGLLEEQGQLEQRIALLEAWLGAAEVVEPAADGRAEMGSVVRVRDGHGETHDHELVGPLESDAANGRISIAAPVGAALVGRRPGDTVEVATPHGPLVLDVVSVRPSGSAMRKAA